jgi:hypothetical protein
MIEYKFSEASNTLGLTPSINNIAKYIFDKFNGDKEFNASLNDDTLPFPEEVQFILDEYDVLVDELMDAITYYIQNY